MSDSDTPHCTLLRNDGGNAAHYLMVRTVGAGGNRDGIGARLVELLEGEEIFEERS